MTNEGGVEEDDLRGRGGGTITVGGIMENVGLMGGDGLMGTLDFDGGAEGREEGVDGITGDG